MPGAGYRQAEMDTLAVLQALGDETRYAHVSRARRLAAACSAPAARRAPRPPHEHRAHASRAHARGRPGRGRAGPPRHGRPAPARLHAGQRRARPRFRPAGTRRARRPARRDGRARSAATPPTPRRRAGLGPRAGRRTRSGSASRRSSSSSASSASTPRSSADGDGTTGRLPAVPVPRPGRGLPRAGVQPAPRDLRRRPRIGRWRKHGTLLDVVRPRPCHVQCRGPDP